MIERSFRHYFTGAGSGYRLKGPEGSAFKDIDLRPRNDDDGNFGIGHAVPSTPETAEELARRGQLKLEEACPTEECPGKIMAKGIAPSSFGNVCITCSNDGVCPLETIAK